MTQDEITKSLKAEWIAFAKKPFPGILPDWLLPKFKILIMEVRQNELKYRADQLHSILSKHPNELHIDEVGLIVNVFLDVKPKMVDKDIHAFIQKRILLDGIRNQVTEMEANEVARLKRKEEALEKLINKKPMIQVP